MVIRKPLEKAKESKVDVDALIEKGANVKSDKNYDDEFTNINLRIPVNMLNEIDALLKDNVGMPRAVWIREAIKEKLKRNSHD